MVQEGNMEDIKLLTHIFAITCIFSIQSKQKMKVDQVDIKLKCQTLQNWETL